MRSLTTTLLPLLALCGVPKLTSAAALPATGTALTDFTISTTSGSTNATANDVITTDATAIICNANQLLVRFYSMKFFEVTGHDPALEACSDPVTCYVRTTLTTHST